MVEGIVDRSPSSGSRRAAALPPATASVELDVPKSMPQWRGGLVTDGLGAAGRGVYSGVCSFAAIAGQTEPPIPPKVLRLTRALLLALLALAVVSPAQAQTLDQMAG